MYFCCISAISFSFFLSASINAFTLSCVPIGLATGGPLLTLGGPVIFFAGLGGGGGIDGGPMVFVPLGAAIAFVGELLLFVLGEIFTIVVSAVTPFFPLSGPLMLPPSNNVSVSTSLSRVISSSTLAAPASPVCLAFFAFPLLALSTPLIFLITPCDGSNG
jgi:hypothetical protein